MPVLVIFLETIEHPRKKQEVYKLLEIFQDISGFPPKMWRTGIIGFGKYHYAYASGQSGAAPLVVFSPRKTKFSLYILPVEEEDLLNRLGKAKFGKSCVYVNKLADIDLDVLRLMIRSCIRNKKKLYPVVNRDGIE